MKIRSRLTWYGVGLTALVLTGFILLISVLVAGSAQSDQDKLLSSTADDAATALSAVEGDDLGAFVPPVLPDASSSNLTFYTVYDDVGQVYYATGTVNGAPLELPLSVVEQGLETGSAETSFLGVRSQIRRWQTADLGAGVVAASQSERFVEEQLTSLRVFLVVSGLIALMAAAVGSWLMAGRALRPVKALVETTDRIASTGDISSRLPSVKQDDEVGALARSFNVMLDSLQTARTDRDEVIDSQKRFLADASHELRSSLTSIRANAGFLAERDDASVDDRRAASRDIAHEADRMSGLIDDLLSLAWSDVASKENQHFAPVDIVAIAHTVSRRARNLDVELTLDVPDAAMVSGDSSEIAELLWILVDNADRHGGSKAVLAIEVNGDDVTVTVSDNGRGVPDGDMSRVFDRFYRADPARSGPGHGLGLAIAQSITTRHSGTIELTNNPNTGATFTIHIPNHVLPSEGTSELASRA